MFSLVLASSPRVNTVFSACSNLAGLYRAPITAGLNTFNILLVILTVSIPGLIVSAHRIRPPSPVVAVLNAPVGNAIQLL